MKISEKVLRAIMPNAEASKVAVYSRIINDYSEEYGINTRLRMAHYLAQIAHESGQLRYVEEIASGKAYEGRKDLGNTQPGDGVRFKGRGLIQLTGRANYTAYAKSVGDASIVKNPSMLATPRQAVRSSMWYWDQRKLNDLADKDDLKGVTRRINGGLNGLTERGIYLTKAKRMLELMA